MRNCRDADIAGSARRAIRAALAGFDRDEGGAIVLLGLVAILILLLLSWVLYDSGQITRNKLDVQAAADTAAYSQAAVKARSMNMLAYANIAKRSVVGIHSEYASLWEAYKDWFAIQVAKCVAGDKNACKVVKDNTPIITAEAKHDYKNFKDTLTDKFYLQDLIAIDNYQRYTQALTPWWSWSEAVLRAARNGATMAASFPAPRGKAVGDPILNTITDQVINKAGGSPMVRYTGHRAMLPVTVSTYDDMANYGMGSGLSFMKYEYPANLAVYKNNSEGGATNPAVIAAARGKFPGKVKNAESVFGEHGKPWRLFHTTTEARWTTWTSNLVLTYRRDKEMFGTMRDKYRVPKQDYKLTDPGKYHLQGYWAMARGEISFHGGQTPDLWHPQWTARLRPVALPGEFAGSGIELSAAYHDVLPYLALSGIVITGDSSVAQDSMNDLVFMERANRALGPSTVEGIAK